MLVAREPARLHVGKRGGLGGGEGAAPVRGAARAVRVVGQREHGAGGADGLDGAEVVAVRVLEAVGAGAAQLVAGAVPLADVDDVVGDARARDHGRAVAGGDVGLLEAAGVERARPAGGRAAEGVGRGPPGGGAQVAGARGSGRLGRRSPHGPARCVVRGCRCCASGRRCPAASRRRARCGRRRVTGRRSGRCAWWCRRCPRGSGAGLDLARDGQRARFEHEINLYAPLVAPRLHGTEAAAAGAARGVVPGRPVAAFLPMSKGASSKLLKHKDEMKRLM